MKGEVDGYNGLPPTGDRESIRKRIYHRIDHHINMSTYSDPLTLHKLRVLMLFVSAINWASIAFVKGPVKFLASLRYYTVWNETFVFLYFFAAVYFHPITKRQSELLTCFQHQVVVSQTIVVIIFWSVLAPNLGLGKDSEMVYINIYKHSIPFLFILHEFYVTYGLYTRKGIWICFGTIIVYSILNLTLALGWDIVVYPTKYTDPHNWESYPLMLVNLLIVVGVGSLYIRMKKGLVVKHFVRTEPQLVERIMKGEPVDGMSSLKNTPGYV